MWRKSAKYFVGVFATPCSGTHFTRRVFEEIGLHVGSEAEPKADGQVAWTTALHPVGTFRLRLHQVRDPVLVISGLQIYAPQPYFRDEVAPRVALQFDGDVVQWATRYWMDWNAHCESRADHRYRIEDFDTEFEELCNHLNVRATMPAVEHTYNSKRQYYEPLTIEAICDALDRQMRSEFVGQCNRYGYDV